MTVDGYLIAIVTHVEIVVLIVECINKVLFLDFPTDFHQLLSILGVKSA
jgi:hypothetical protein